MKIPAVNITRWTQDANNNIYRTDGYVGIGTSSPNEQCTVNGSLSLAYMTAPVASSQYGKIYVDSENGNLYFIDSAGTVVSLSGVSSTVSEHYKQHSEAIRTILKDLDGYTTSVQSGVSEGTFLENKNFWNNAIATIRKDLDGYGSGGGLSETTFLENKNFWNDAVATIRKDLDGYSALISGLDSTELEHYNQHSSVIQTIIKDLDGYSTAGLSETTFLENKNFWNSSIETILKDLDGYASDTTVSEHYRQHSDALQSIIKDLDGYASSGVSSAQDSDGYIAFFTGSSAIAGDNDLFWNRETNTFQPNRTVASTTILVTSEVDNGTQSSDYTIDWNSGQKQKITLGASITLTFVAPTTGVGNFLLKVVQDGNGSRVITWPGTVLWPAAMAPTLTTDSDAIDIVSFYWDGTNWFGVASLDFG